MSSIHYFSGYITVNHHQRRRRRHRNLELIGEEEASVGHSRTAAVKKNAAATRDFPDHEPKRPAAAAAAQ